VDLGRIDGKEARNMSGGWRRSLKLSSSTRVTHSLPYKLVQAANYNDDELSQVLLTIDDEQYGTGSNSYVAQLAAVTITKSRRSARLPRC
jgi:hypothetical protein